MFAGSCIGVVLLVMSLEMLRRFGREYDSYIRRKDNARRGSEDRNLIPPSTSDTSKQTASVSVQRDRASYRTSRIVMIQRQFIRALLHMLQFSVAYFIMLMAMYYNGE